MNGKMEAVALPVQDMAGLAAIFEETNETSDSQAVKRSTFDEYYSTGPSTVVGSPIPGRGYRRWPIAGRVPDEREQILMVAFGHG